MRQAIHHHYEQLTADETRWVDDVFAEIMASEQSAGEWAFPGTRPPLAGDDRVERAVDALARAVIESRPSVNKPAGFTGKPIPIHPTEDDPPIDGAMEVHLALKGAGLL